MANKAPARFASFVNKAQKMVGSNSKLTQLVAQALAKLATTPGQSLQELRDQVSLCIDLVKAWVAGDYRDVASSTLVSVVAALLYFVVPVDVVPDFLLGWGLLDDAAVLAYVFSQLHEELERFKSFRDRDCSDGSDQRERKLPTELPDSSNTSKLTSQTETGESD